MFRVHTSIVLLGILASTSVIAQNKVDPKNADPYSGQRASQIISENGLGYFKGPNLTPAYRLGKAFQKNSDNLQNFVGNVFAPAALKIQKAYEKKNAKITLADSESTAEFVVAEDFYNGRNSPRKLNRQVEFVIHRTAEEDAYLKQRLGDELFEKVYNEEVNALNANPIRSSDPEVLKTVVAKMKEQGLQASVLIKTSMENFMAYESFSNVSSDSLNGLLENPVQPGAQVDYEIYLNQELSIGSSSDVIFENRNNGQVQIVKASEITPELLGSMSYTHVHTSMSNFHAIYEMLSGAEKTLAPSKEWMSNLIQILKSSETGKVEISIAPEAAEILQLLKPEVCSISV